MDLQSISELKNQLNQWNYFLLHHDKESSTKIKEVVDQSIQELEGDFPQLDYSLVSCRHELLVTRNFDQAKHFIDDLEIHRMQFNSYHEYFLHYLKGLYYYGLKQYDKSLESYQTAYQMSDLIQDPIEKAELYYKTGTVYFHLDYLTPSIEWVEKANLIFAEEGYTKRNADCHVLIAQNYKDGYNFDKATENLETAQRLYNKLDNHDNFNVISQVLGSLYAKQKRSHDAIESFEKGLKCNNNNDLALSILYPLSREYFKIKNDENGKQRLADGLEICKNNKTEEYFHHFNILEARHTLRNAFNDRLMEGISYFHREGMWEYVEEYSNEFADLLFKEGHYKEASESFRLALKARNNNSIKGK